MLLQRRGSTQKGHGPARCHRRFLHPRNRRLAGNSIAVRSKQLELNTATDLIELILDIIYYCLKKNKSFICTGSFFRLANKIFFLIVEYCDWSHLKEKIILEFHWFRQIISQ